MKKILIQKDDIKARLWAKEAERLGLGELYPCPGSPMGLPFHFLKLILRDRKFSGVCFRYLNDYPSYLKSLVRLFTDFLTVVLAITFRKDVYWICHNVDKETNEFHPGLVALRRTVLKKVAQKIFVTDELLLQPAEKLLDVCVHRLRVITFGLESALDNNDSSRLSEIQAINNWVLNKKREDREARVGLWIGTLEEKKLVGLRKALELAQEAVAGDGSLYFVIVGPINAWLAKNAPQLLVQLQSCPNILFVGVALDVPASTWGELFDFIWKPLDDLSVSLTAFNSATARVPLFCEAGTFMGKYVEHYQIGYAVAFDKLSCTDVQQRLDCWSSEPCEHFLETHTWTRGARALFGS